MRQARMMAAAGLVIGVALGLSAMAAGTIETVTVGNPNNDADGSGYGAVGCQYNIGKHEASAGQYAKSSAPSRRPTPAGCTAPPWIQRAISPAATLSGAARRAATRTAWRATGYKLQAARTKEPCHVEEEEDVFSRIDHPQGVARHY